jgi:phosphate transport system ATP-binding protein
MPSSVDVKNLDVSYGEKPVLKGITLAIPPGKVTAIIGPSGCGKTTLLRCLNRLSELTKGCKVSGQILVDGENIVRMDRVLLRRKIGMVFQKPNPFPMSIRENVLYGVKATKMNIDFDTTVEWSLSKAALWDEIQERLGDHAFGLSLGQQQRLCIARTLAIAPQVILMDEPAASLDPNSTMQVEDSILSLKDDYTIIIVTHNMQQARRVADYTAFLYLGYLVEFGETEQIFRSPRYRETREYISGRFG